MARAFLRRPKVLLLDEVTSAMDTDNEQVGFIWSFLLLGKYDLVDRHCCMHLSGSNKKITILHQSLLLTDCQLFLHVIWYVSLTEDIRLKLVPMQNWSVNVESIISCLAIIIFHNNTLARSSEKLLQTFKIIIFVIYHHYRIFSQFLFFYNLIDDLTYSLFFYTLFSSIYECMYADSSTFWNQRFGTFYLSNMFVRSEKRFC